MGWGWLKVGQAEVRGQRRESSKLSQESHGDKAGKASEWATAREQRGLC